MKKYKVILEVMFVRVQSEAGKWGFYATFFPDAASARIAVDRACLQLLDRMTSLHVIPLRGGVLQTRVLVSDIWEIEDQAASPKMDGVSLYEMGPISCIKALVHYFRMRLFKSYYVVPMAFDEIEQVQAQ